MYIEKIIISGFKSYREHTVIDGFDQYFNAITGPNGSGKSNILDAICFVLGISNLSQVRASTLQELIYKEGQSGVTKASVEIIFNNSDKNNSPTGYDQCDVISIKRQMVAGSSSKYFINNQNANQTRVLNLFHSVQLNVNNPHFLIMQGRITKVLNMKPLEILGLIEEAAGIKMFENKKTDSLKILEKKDKQLEEINRVMSEEISPYVEKLRQERDRYNEFLKKKNEINKYEKWIVAFEYKQYDKAVTEGEKSLEEAQANLSKVEESEKEKENELEEVHEKIKEYSTRKEGNEKKEYEELDKNLTRVQKDITKEKTLLKQANDEIKRLNSKKNEYIKQLEEAKSNQNDKNNDVERYTEELKTLTEKLEESEQEVKKLEERINAINFGVSDEGDSSSLSDQIDKQKKIAAEADVRLHEIEKSKSRDSREISELRTLLRRYENELNELTEKKKDREQQLDRIDQELRKLGFDQQKFDELTNEKQNLMTRYNETREQIYNLERRISNTDFTYNAKNDQATQLLNNKVHGVLARLIELKDKRYTVAMEKVAGGKLYNVVVDNVDAATCLTDKKMTELRNRATIIPLDKIRHDTLKKEKITKSKKVAQTAQFALDLVKPIDPKYKNAVEYAFGQTIITDSQLDAKNVTFDKSINIRTVTKDGDVYDPQGTLTGGSSHTQSRVLADLARYLELQDQLENIGHRLDEISGILNQMNRNYQLSCDLVSRQSLARHELDLAVDAINGSMYQSTLNRINAIEEKQAINVQEIEDLAKQKEEASQNLTELNNTLKNWANQKQAKLDEFNNRLKEAHKKRDQDKAAKSKKEEELTLLKSDLKDWENDIQRLSDLIKESDETMEKLTAQIEENNSLITKHSEEKIDIEKHLEELKERMKETDSLLNECIKTEDSLKKSLNQLKIQKNKLDHQIKQSMKDRENAAEAIQELLHDYPWIKTEERFFGIPHTEFDFKLYDYKDAKKKYQNLLEEHDDLESHVNKRAISQYEKAKNDLNNLQSKKDQVESEREKINDVIARLEIKKNEAIKTTHIKVNNDLDSIVQGIIPGTSANLIPLPGKTVCDGLELIVKFSDVQKTLQELSGGQRSLIALALILALLKFKPAPIYILDEIDAALDLNYTQNIGAMLRRNFRKAQFIVVSLKEGMFNNANVVFRTSFVDSNSIVRRTVNIPK